MRAGIVVKVTPIAVLLSAITTRRKSMFGAPKSSWRRSMAAARLRSRGDPARPSRWWVWRWQARFMAEGIAGLTRDKTAAVAGSHRAAGD
jgi:hypothetical protein